MTKLRRACGLAAFLALAACSNADLSADSSATGDANRVARGAALYQEMCSVCHGSQGQGGSGPMLSGWTREADELVRIIDERMPQGQPDRCRGGCAEDIAAFILSGFAHPDPVCTAPAFGPRRLRLLTRREYRNTIATLFGWDDTSCLAPSFRYQPMGRTLRTVHVAGSMNGWPQTIAGGGWPLTRSTSDGEWSLRQAMSPGTYQYKFVLDESEWVTDPNNPQRSPDGFGGYNSVLTVTCKPKSPPAPIGDVTAKFAPDTRPAEFPFDNEVDARLVTPDQADEYRRAAQAIAQAVAADLSTLLPCDGAGTTGRACAATFLSSFGLRAFRRPLTPAELDRYETLILGGASFADGIKRAIAALLQSPHFLYRAELGEPDVSGGFRLTPYEVASALSYLYVGTMPDAELFAAAARGELVDAVSIERQARRLLALPQARTNLGDFALAWLGVEKVLTVDKRSDLFPQWSDALKQSLAQETQRFVSSVAFDGSGRLDELFTADYSFLNAALGQLYGVSGVSGDGLRKSAYGTLAVPRAGLLAHGSVLASYAYSDQTSPIRRGLFVRRSLLCQELPSPPPNAGGVPKVEAGATTRERFRQHTDSAFCRSCHQYIDGVGFGFERFDPIAQARQSEAGQPIDASGDMNDLEGLGTGTHAEYLSLPELGAALAAAQSSQACFVRQYLRFARGRHEDVAADLCTLDRLKRRFRERDRSLVELFVEVTQLPEFLHRR